jgi:VWFA-related protein
MGQAGWFAALVLLASNMASDSAQDGRAGREASDRLQQAPEIEKPDLAPNAGPASIRRPEGPDHSAPAQPEAQAQNPQPAYVMRVKTRLVTVDVVATDSHGTVVRDLKADEFQIFEHHAEPQKIEQFEFVELAAQKKPVPEAAPSGFYANETIRTGLTVPPTILLVDGLNTALPDQVVVRQHMIRLLRTLDGNTPVAVFLMGRRLYLVQNFTTDPSMLRAAVDKALVPGTPEEDPRDEVDSASNLMLQSTGGRLGPNVLALQNFEKEQYANSVDFRLEITLNSLRGIARYLSGYRGRKNLIWLSGSFPLNIVPDPNNGSDLSAGVRDYAPLVHAVANDLTDAQIAVYPVDARGLTTQGAFAPSEQSRKGVGLVGSFGTHQGHEQDARLSSQDTMGGLAADTGGRECKNNNDLSACVQTAMKDGSAYYELAYYPRLARWDGTFRDIVVKTTRPGVKLRHRRGYYAIDSSASAREQSPQKLLQQACADSLSSTQVFLTAKAVPPSQAKQLKYLVAVDPSGVSFTKNRDLWSLDLQMAVCEYAAKADSFLYANQSFVSSVSDGDYQVWKKLGVPQFVEIQPHAETRRLRVVVLDVPTGLIGSVDLPVRPQDFLTPQPIPGVTQSRKSASVTEEPASVAPAAEEPRFVQFRVKSGQSGQLDWNGDTLIYRGDLPADQSAPVFFQLSYSTKFHCQSGTLVSNLPTGAPPNLRLRFRNPAGKLAVVDLTGAQPDYSGELRVDSSAKLFFDRVWALSHCHVR